MEEVKVFGNHIKFRLLKFLKPVSVHTEAVFIDTVWEYVKQYAKNGKSVWYVTTPADFDFIKAEIGCPFSKKKWERIIVSRYKWLQSEGQEIQLYIHLKIKPNMCNTAEIELKIKSGLSWLHKRGFDPTKVSFAWWSFDDRAVDIARKYKLSTLRRMDSYFTRDHDLLNESKLLNFRQELNIIRDYYHYKKITRTRKITVHTECIHKDDVWKAVKNYVNRGGNAIWYAITPTDFDLVKEESGIYTTKKEWEKTILNRYRWLQSKGQEIQLHIHLKILLHLLTSGEKRNEQNRIKHAIRWFRSRGFKVTEITFGWWSYDKEAMIIVKKLGCKMIKRTDNYYIHDYDFIKTYTF